MLDWVLGWVKACTDVQGAKGLGVCSWLLQKKKEEAREGDSLWDAYLRYVCVCLCVCVWGGGGQCGRRSS